MTFQILDQAGCIGAVEILQAAHHTATSVFLDGPEHAQDPGEKDYTPPPNT